MRPLWFEWPEDESVFDIDNQFMVGSALLVKPITAPGVTATTVQLPGSEPWFDGHTHGKLTPGRHEIQAPLGVIPFFHRGGSIVPRRDRPRRNSALMANDPFTLVVALDSKQQASGELYMDDGHSFDWKKGSYVWRSLDFKNSQLTSGMHSDAASSGAFNTDVVVERVIILGLETVPTRIVARIGNSEAVQLEFLQHHSSGALVIRKPELPVSSSWTVSLEK